MHPSTGILLALGFLCWLPQCGAAAQASSCQCQAASASKTSTHSSASLQHTSVPKTSSLAQKLDAEEKTAKLSSAPQVKLRGQASKKTTKTDKKKTKEKTVNRPLTKPYPNILTTTTHPSAKTPSSQCHESHYHKSLLVTGFSRANPSTERVGRLENTASALPKVLAKRLRPSYQLQVQKDLSLSLPSNNRLLHNQYGRFNAVQEIAQRYHTQYVLSGAVLDMAMFYPQRYFHQNLFSPVTNWFRSDANDLRRRHFVFSLTLYDGVSGAAIFTHTYTTDGLWDSDYTDATGFASPRFWATDYGRAVNLLVNKAVDAVGAKLHCESFMATLKFTENSRHIYLLAGTDSGVAVGDTFTVYARSQAPFANLAYRDTAAVAPAAYPQLQPSGASLHIQQTYPNYSVGSLSIPLRPNFRYMAVAR